MQMGILKKSVMGFHFSRPEYYERAAALSFHEPKLNKFLELTLVEILSKRFEERTFLSCHLSRISPACRTIALLIRRSSAIVLFCEAMSRRFLFRVRAHVTKRHFCDWLGGLSGGR